MFILQVILALYILTLIFSCKEVAAKIYRLETPLFRSEVKIVLVSDLHGAVYGKDQIHLTGKIKEQNPDLIVLTGDIFDSLFFMKGTQLFLSGISGIGPVYYVTGNHEYRSRKITEIKNKLKSYGITVLSGHTHGGQIRIPNILNGLYAPNQGFFPKYGGGMYTRNNLTHIISRGLSRKILFPRICNPPELVVIEIRSNL